MKAAVIVCRWSLALALSVLAPSLVSARVPKAEQVVIGQRVRARLTSQSGIPVQQISEVLQLGSRVIAVEEGTNALFVLDLDGTLLSRKSNTGPGSAMLGEPVQLAAISDREFITIDAQAPRVVRFSLRNDMLELGEVVRLATITGVDGVCNLGGNTYVLGRTIPPEKSKLLHVLGRNAAVAQSIGDVFGKPTDDFGKIFFGSAEIMCLGRERQIAVAARHYPEVRAYNPGGDLVWAASLPEFRQVTYREVKPGSFQYTYPLDGVWDSTVSVFQPAPDVVAVQVGRRKGRGGGPFVSLRSFLFSTKDGRMIGVQANLPLVKEASGNRLYSVDESGGLWFLSHSLVERSK